MIKSEIQLKNCLDDLYKLGVIQGEHNINWADEYNLLEHSKRYYHKTKSIADKYSIDYSDSPEDYRENDDEKEYVFDMNGFLYNYYLACKDRKRAKNKINLYIKLNKHMVMDIKYLETLSLLNTIFDKIEIVESLRW